MRAHDWQPSDPGDIANFSEHFRASVVNEDVEERFCESILALLNHMELSERYETIAKAHRDTYQWALEKHGPTPEWDDYPKWLSGNDGQNIYWISGKPGSGKSTLMKYIFNNARLNLHLEPWSSGRRLVKAGYFFWNSGTHIQMSRSGLLRSILYTCLKGDNATLMHLCSERYKRFLAFGGGRHPFTWSELLQIFKTMTHQPVTPRNFFFMIDGLDEADGEPNELIELILETAKLPYVKICAASRAWLVFADAFECRPRLFMERLTKSDIKTFVNTSFGNNKSYARLCSIEPKGAAELVSEVVDKAEGVFLWVRLVVQSLMDGISNADSLSDLKARLDQLPPDLEQLYKKLLNRMTDTYYKRACQLVRLIMENPRPPLLTLCYADDDHDDSCITADIKILDAQEMMVREEMMSRRLVSHCQGFFEVSEIEDMGLHVNWIHRSAKDFLRTDAMWKDVLRATPGMNVSRRWANGLLGHLKASTSFTSGACHWVFECLEYALRVEQQSGVCPIEYLDEVDRIAKSRGLYKEMGNLCKGGKPVSSLLDLAILLNMTEYMYLKGLKVSDAELSRAASFRGKLSVCAIYDYNTPLLREYAGIMSRYENIEKLGPVLDEDSKWKLCPKILSTRQIDKVLKQLFRERRKQRRAAQWQRIKQVFQ